jgi:hypothetical protein
MPRLLMQVVTLLALLGGPTRLGVRGLVMGVGKPAAESVFLISGITISRSLRAFFEFLSAFRTLYSSRSGDGLRDRASTVGR